MATAFGKDTSCTGSLRPGVVVTGVRLVGEAIFRRLTTPRGMLRGGEQEADYGLDMLELVGASVTPGDIAALPGRVRNEVLKDPRIVSVEVTATTTKVGPATTLTLVISCVTGEGPFDLTVGVDEASVELLGISGAA